MYCPTLVRELRKKRDEAKKAALAAKKAAAATAAAARKEERKQAAARAAAQRKQEAAAQRAAGPGRGPAPSRRRALAYTYLQEVQRCGPASRGPHCGTMLAMTLRGSLADALAGGVHLSKDV